MGDKARRQAAMKKAGVPMLPGSDGPVENEEKALKVAKEIGYPVIIKAVAGGGGRGMRVVRTAPELSHCGPPSARPRPPSVTATSTSRSYLENPGTSSSRSSAITTAIVHLGERECSIQRRHQKLIEESPSPALSDKIRRRWAASSWMPPKPSNTRTRARSSS